MTTSVEIPHAVERELKAKGFNSNQIKNLFNRFIRDELDLDLEEASYNHLETYIESNRDVLERDFPVLAQEVVIEEYES